MAASPTPSPAIPGRPKMPRTIYARVDFVPVGDGTFKAVPRVPRYCRDLVSISEAAKVTAMKREMLYRLYKAGFVEGEQASPGKIFLSVPSLLEHIEAARSPEFWTPQRKARYSVGWPD